MPEVGSVVEAVISAAEAGSTGLLWNPVVAEEVVVASMRVE